MAIPYLQGETKLHVSLNLNSESVSTVAEVFLLRPWLQLFKPNPSITHLIFTVCLFGWPSTTRLIVVFSWCQWDLILTIKTCYLGGIFQTIRLAFLQKKKLIKLLLFACIKCIINYTCLTGLKSPLQKGKCIRFLTKSCITHSAETNKKTQPTVLNQISYHWLLTSVVKSSKLRSTQTWFNRSCILT